jgi:hypothetical protein
MKYVTCSVNICRNSKSNTVGKNFFSFPSIKQPDRHNAWIRACAKEKAWKPSVSNSVICEDHFHLSDYMQTAGKKKKILRKTAVPHLKLDQSVRVNHDGQIPYESPPVLGSRQDLISPATVTTKTNNLIDKTSKHWLSKIKTFKTCSVCNEKTDWQCDAPICQKPVCLSPCFSKHQEHHQVTGNFTYNYCIFTAIYFIFLLNVLSFYNKTGLIRCLGLHFQANPTDIGYP